MINDLKIYERYCTKICKENEASLFPLPSLIPQMSFHPAGGGVERRKRTRTHVQGTVTLCLLGVLLGSVSRSWPPQLSIVEFLGASLEVDIGWSLPSLRSELSAQLVLREDQWWLPSLAAGYSAWLSPCRRSKWQVAWNSLPSSGFAFNSSKCPRALTS